ncbi:hypothetical protein HPG69_012672 [Diceros bicornis minor]|uniref:Uncharacterized protein n=1 Tax=Diceros bicornis minor TaxID=77932 RepID=A0A7J7EIQ2_DICBM|nr:hypothetical protein HPG69_012672 [Diceros bicornis minor]
MERRSTNEPANQERHGGRARSARSSGPGIPKAGSALPARGGRAPPGPGFLAVKQPRERQRRPEPERSRGRREAGTAWRGDPATAPRGNPKLGWGGEGKDWVCLV